MSEETNNETASETVASGPVVGENLSDSAVALLDKMKEEGEFDQASPDENQENNESSTEPSGEEKQEVSDKGQDTFTFKVKGKDQEFTHDQIRHALSREDTFQKKYNDIEQSEAYRLGVLMSAAKEGNKGAQKKLKDMLVGFTGASDDDSMLDSLDSVDETFDENEATEKKRYESSMEASFSDVKDSVDFEKNIGIVQSELKELMPEKVWESYWDDPEARRTMYDLVASGRMTELMETFNRELESLPLVEQVKIKRDPDWYGDLFVAVVKQQNARQVDKSNKDQGPTEADAVSTGELSRSKSATSDPGPNFDNMTSAEFAEWKRKNGISA